jgi:PAS domain S-box-containing protein
VLGKLAGVLRPEGGETWRDEYRFEKADGSYAVVVDRAYVVRDGATGEPVRMLGAMADVTERRRDEEALRRGEELYRLTFEAAPVGLAHVAPDGRWLEINDKLCGISGYSREELLGMTYRDVMHPDDLEAGLERLGRLIRGESGPYSAEARYVRKDGSRIWARVSVSLLRGPSGKPERLVCVAEDITARKLRELLPDPLDEREIAVLRGIAAGKTIERIARDTVSSPGTVKRDARRVLAKLKGANPAIETREQAARWAVEVGLVPPS